ncbi:MAG: hypothetical protein KGD63_00885 [Candidatus Lokiarchaeota archaeon]|nr:hypothetical protein [Candidatus Lokiarchaeota archaeon]
MSSEKYEDVFFYLDLAKDYIKKKSLLSLIEEYIEKKRKYNLKGQFALLFFSNDDFPIFNSDQSDSVKFSETLDLNWKNRTTIKSNFEKGLFYILSYVAESIRKKSKSNRIIILTDTPSELSEGYQEALYDLISKVKYFPTFIDVIRVVGEGKRFFKDDVKLNIIASDTRGGIFYTHDKKELKLVFNQLVKVKELVNLYSDRPEHIEITQEDLMFYRNLSKNLIESESKEDLMCNLCNKEICPICSDVYDIPKSCEECGTSFHNCCILEYSVEFNIGIPFIFRCPKCGILLKLKKEQLDKEGEEIKKKLFTESRKLDNSRPTINIKDKEKQSFYQDKKDTNLNLDVKVELPLKIMIPEHKSQNLHIEDDDIKIIRVGGYFGKLYKVRKKEGKLSYEKFAP